MLRAAIYLRYATNSGSVNTNHEQFMICHNKIVEEDTCLVKKYSDINESGTNPNRLGLTTLLADSEKGIFDVVIVEQLHRLTRGPDLHKLLEHFNYYNIRFISVSEGIDSSQNYSNRLGLKAIMMYNFSGKSTQGI